MVLLDLLVPKNRSQPRMAWEVGAWKADSCVPTSQAERRWEKSPPGVPLLSRRSLVWFHLMQENEMTSKPNPAQPYSRVMQVTGYVELPHELPIIVVNAPW